ncbi:Uncharacterised protein [Vibrio cholerae]|nr:Uncharacterised protein [Vibrio cholerae]
MGNIGQRLLNQSAGNRPSRCNRRKVFDTKPIGITQFTVIGFKLTSVIIG